MQHLHMKQPKAKPDPPSPQVSGLTSSLFDLLIKFEFIYYYFRLKGSVTLHFCFFFFRKLFIPKFLRLFPFPWQQWPPLWWPPPARPSQWQPCLPHWSRPPSHLSQPHPPLYPWWRTLCPFPWGSPLPWWHHSPSPPHLSPTHNHQRPPAVDQWDGVSQTSVTSRSQPAPQRVRLK